jgi:hypothetical protein
LKDSCRTDCLCYPSNAHVRVYELQVDATDGDTEFATLGRALRPCRLGGSLDGETAWEIEILISRAWAASVDLIAGSRLKLKSFPASPQGGTGCCSIVTLNRETVMHQDRRDFLRLGAGAYAAAVQSTHVQAAAAQKGRDDRTGLSLWDASELVRAGKASVR